MAFADASGHGATGKRGAPLVVPPPGVPPPPPKVPSLDGFMPTSKSGGPVVSPGSNDGGGTTSKGGSPAMMKAPQLPVKAPTQASFGPEPGAAAMMGGPPSKAGSPPENEGDLITKFVKQKGLSAAAESALRQLPPGQAKEVMLMNGLQEGA